MASYVMLLKYTSQGAKAISDTTKRAAAAADMAGKMGVKIREVLWTMGAIDLVLICDAGNDEAMAAVAVKLASAGNVSTQTLRAFSSKEVDAILAKAK